MMRKAVRVLTRQPIDLDRPHPFTAAGNTEFNSCIWMPPNEQRAGAHLAGGLHDIHDLVRRDRKPGKILEKFRQYVTQLAAHMIQGCFGAISHGGGAL